MPPQIDTLELIADHNTVRFAIQWLDAIANREKWSSTLKFSLVISLDEALTNIVSYAFGNALFMSKDDRTKTATSPCTIVLRCLLWPAQVQLEIVDNGRPYDPTLAATPALADSIEHARLGGHGLRLMRHYLSDMSYVRRDNRNCLLLSTSTQKAESIEK